MILIDLLPYIGLLLLTILVPLFVNNKKTYTIILFLVYVVFCGFRYGVGWDYFNYMYAIEYGGWSTSKMELLYGFLCHFCNKHGFVQFFFVVTSFVIVLLVFLMFIKESEDPAISIFVFLCFTFFLNSLVIIRYFMAASAIFLACHFGYKKQYIPYFSLLFVALFFHQAAFLGFLTVPFALGKIKFNLTINLIVFVTCFVLGTVIGSFSFINSIFTVLSSSGDFDAIDYGGRYMVDTGGANFSRTPYVFALINLINLLSIQSNNQCEKDPQLYHYVTMYNVGCSLMFLLSFNAIFANRLSLFFTIFLTLIVPFYKKKTLHLSAIYAICLFVFFYELTIKASHPLFIGRQNCWLPYTMNFSF